MGTNKQLIASLADALWDAATDYEDDQYSNVNPIIGYCSVSEKCKYTSALYNDCIDLGSPSDFQCEELDTHNDCINQAEVFINDVRSTIEEVQ